MPRQGRPAAPDQQAETIAQEASSVYLDGGRSLAYQSLDLISRANLAHVLLEDRPPLRRANLLVPRAVVDGERHDMIERINRTGLLSEPL
jgi:hypothetical protein